MYSIYICTLCSRGDLDTRGPFRQNTSVGGAGETPVASMLAEVGGWCKPRARVLVYTLCCDRSVRPTRQGHSVAGGRVNSGLWTIGPAMPLPADQIRSFPSPGLSIAEQPERRTKLGLLRKTGPILSAARSLKMQGSIVRNPQKRDIFGRVACHDTRKKPKSPVDPVTDGAR